MYTLCKLPLANQSPRIPEIKYPLQQPGNQTISFAGRKPKESDFHKMNWLKFSITFTSLLVASLGLPQLIAPFNAGKVSHGVLQFREASINTGELQELINTVKSEGKPISPYNTRLEIEGTQLDYFVPPPKAEKDDSASAPDDNPEKGQIPDTPEELKLYVEDIQEDIAGMMEQLDTQRAKLMTMMEGPKLIIKPASKDYVIYLSLKEDQVNSSIRPCMEKWSLKNWPIGFKAFGLPGKIYQKVKQQYGKGGKS